MDLKLYNTRTRSKELFVPLDPALVRMYSCGPTVYNYPHIGNFRAYVVADIVKRAVGYAGYPIKHVINVTDIGHLVDDGDDGDDKMTRALVREGMPLTLEAMRTLAEKYFESFKDGLHLLNVLAPDVFPFASDHITENISLIEELGERGYIYTTRDGIYFDTEKMPDYGVLGGSASVEHSRIGVSSEKRNPRDFALWKFDEKIGYDAPFGKGFPGWHIECSAMSMKYLGESFDIHTGGVDHISVHHNNEIAQSESATGKELARYWLHNEFITILGEKVSKSLSNEIYLSDLREKGYSPLAFRLMLLGAHYRTQMNFSWDALEAAHNAYIRAVHLMKNLPDGGMVDNTYKAKFEDAIGDDLNTALALAVFWNVVTDQNISPQDKKATLIDFDRVLGLGLADIREDIIPREITHLAEQREDARQAKDWARSDELRQEIENAGYVVRDTSDGFIVEKK